MFKSLLSEDQEYSTMRVMSFISLIVGAAIAIIGLCLNKDLSAVAILSGVFVGAAFGGKVTQKAVETRREHKE